MINYSRARSASSYLKIHIGTIRFAADVKKEEAEAIKEKLEAVGGTVSLE